jgi:hypothetical protein
MLLVWIGLIASFGLILVVCVALAEPSRPEPTLEEKFRDFEDNPEDWGGGQVLEMFAMPEDWYEADL